MITIIINLNMAYDLFIEREKKILKEEWLSYLNSNADFEIIQKYSVNFGDGKRIKIQTPNSGLWNAGNYKVPFIFSERSGRISVTRPGNQEIEKMITIAKSLNAVVRGDEGEIYDEAYLKNRKRDSNAIKKPWWKFWT